MNSTSNGHDLGYSILRSGAGESFEACIVMPHVEAPKSVSFDAISRRLDVQMPSVAVSLPEIPADVAHLLAQCPERVLLVSTDTLSAVRSSARLDTLVVKH